MYKNNLITVREIIKRRVDIEKQSLIRSKTVAKTGLYLKHTSIRRMDSE
jgi:hypothetical protein